MRSSRLAAQARRRRPFALIGGNKCASSRRKCAKRGSPRRLYALLHFTKQSHFGCGLLDPGDFHVYDRRRRDITFGVPAGLEAL
jgi:hypothetical protein